MGEQKVYILLSETLDENTGIGKKILSQKEALSKLFGYTNLIQVKELNGKLVRISEDTNYCYDLLPNNPIGKFLSYFKYDKILKKAIENKVDIFYIRFTHFANPFFISFLKKLKTHGIAVYLEIPTYPYDKEYDSVKLTSKLKLKMDQLFRNKIGKYVDKIITYSDDSKIFGASCLNISNAVNNINLPVYNNKLEKVLNLIGVANLGPWHGYDRLINSLRLYDPSVNNNVRVIFHIVGDGEELEKYKSMVKTLNLEKAIRFYGVLNGDNLNQVFEKAHIGVDSLGRHRSGNNYNNSLKSKEYIARGLPIIKSHIDNTIPEPLCWNVTPDDLDFDISDIVNWYVSSEFDSLEISSFGKKEFTWQFQFQNIKTDYLK
mgnify:CR=1 FL=1